MYDRNEVNYKRTILHNDKANKSSIIDQTSIDVYKNKEEDPPSKDIYRN